MTASAAYAEFIERIEVLSDDDELSATEKFEAHMAAIMEYYFADLEDERRAKLAALTMAQEQ